MDKETWSIYTRKCYSAIRKDESPPFTSMWMELEGIMLIEEAQRKTIVIWFQAHMKYTKQCKGLYREREGKLNGKKSERETNHDIS